MERFMCAAGRGGDRGDGSICVVLMRESEEKEKTRGKGQCGFVSFITQQPLCCRGHLKLIACLISSGDSLQSLCVYTHLCHLCAVCTLVL